MQFLTNIESSLLPYGMLEPPLWSERKQKEELKTAANEKRKQSNEEKPEKITEKVTNEKNVNSQEGEENGNISNMDEKENKSPVTKKKRIFPFSLSRRKKDVSIWIAIFIPKVSLIQLVCKSTFINIIFYPILLGERFRRQKG